MPSIKADTVVRNASVITIDPSRPRAQAVAIREGKFLAVGDNNDIEDLIGPDTKQIDASGSTVVPGFIDAHIHVLSSGSRHVMSADCDQRSVPAIQDALRERARQTPSGEWVQGFKFDDN